VSCSIHVLGTLVKIDDDDDDEGDDSRLFQALDEIY
jgi:hypothetical protein